MIVGKLMLIQGLIDENVHFRHTARLINALIKARKPYDLFLFPDERHMPRARADRVYTEERIRDFCVEQRYFISCRCSFFAPKREKRTT